MINNFVHIDFETRSGADLLKCGADVYSQHPTTDALCLAYAFNDEPVQLWTPSMPEPTKLLEHVHFGGRTLGHNIGGFEMLIWNNVMTLKYGWPELKIEQCEDTMAMAYAMSLPGSLDDASRAAGIPYQKDMKGHQVMLKLSQPKAAGPVFWEPSEVPNDFEKLYAYCKQDVEVERGLCKRLLRLSKQEQKLWELDFKINRRGVFVDLKAAKAAVTLVEQEKVRLNLKMREVTGGAVAMCTATGQLSDWLKSKGLQVPSVAKADVVEMLSRPDLPIACKEALLLRQEAAKTSTAKLQAMINGASIGGRVRGLFQYHGAGTGRWAGRRIQLQNLPRPKLKQDDIDKIFIILDSPVSDFAKLTAIKVYAPPMSGLSDCIRGFLRAKPGSHLVAVDFSAIEARVIAWLAGEDKTLEIFKGHGKIYEATAADIYRCKIEDIFKEDPRRQVGKVAILALGFQGGVGALQQMCKAYGITLEPTFESLWGRATAEHKDRADFIYNMNGKKHDISKKEFYASDLIKQYWRDANPNIVKFWADLEQAAIAAVEKPGQVYKAGSINHPTVYKMAGSFLWCQLPSGRVLCYPYAKVEMKVKFKDAPPSPTLTYMDVDSYTKKWERRKSYGGLLAENVTQAVARDLLADAITRLEDKGCPVVMHVHDEVVGEIPESAPQQTLSNVEKIASQVPPWAAGLPIEAKGWRGVRYRK